MPSMFRPLCRLAAVIAALAVAGPLTAQTPAAQPPAAEDPERKHAFDVYESGKLAEAMPLLESVAASHPTDAVVYERWANAVVSYAATLPNAEDRKKVRARGHQIALKAKALGGASPILSLLLEIPDDGTEAPFSASKEVDDAMRSAEAAFVQGDMKNAQAGYLRALLLDPKLYEAALFMGDTYYRDKAYPSAGEWFARAIEIDPNREVAYRYWADALAGMGKNEESRARFIDAVVAEPYSELSWSGLQKWTRGNKVDLVYVKLKDGSSVSVKDSKNVSVTLDSSFAKGDPNATAWLSYGLGRAAWQTDDIKKKESPNVPRSRHTLQEEVYALRFMVTVMKESKTDMSPSSKLDPGLKALVEIEGKGFLEPFVLLNRADDGVRQDYEEYRKSNRALVRRYLDEFVVPKAGAAK